MLIVADGLPAREIAEVTGSGATDFLIRPVDIAHLSFAVEPVR